MPPKVTLTVTHGPNTGQQFVFEERATAIIGRDMECLLKFPKDREHQTISRHHCLLDINPPDVRIRDMGSRTGTYINDRLIGKRDQAQTAEQGREVLQPEIELKHGDQIKLGKLVLQVAVSMPAVCSDCSIEIPDQDVTASKKPSGEYQCAECRFKEQSAGPVVVTISRKLCPRCGKDVSSDIGSKRRGELLCATCKANPMQLAQRLVDLAQSGTKELVAIQGYKIGEELGQGGMGAVYLARHEETGRQVALKVMLPSIAANKRSREMFLREANNTKLLKHRHVVQMFDLGNSEGSFYFTMEFCEGGSIADLLKKRKEPLAVAKAVKMIIQALEGLEYAHEVEIPAVKLADGSVSQARGLVHRDIKPQNIFLARSGDRFHAKVGDYGLAKAFDAAGLSGMSVTGVTAGTPVFMPRQQLIDYKYSRPEVDVWAMAASLYYMLTRQYPRDFPRGKDPWQIVLQTDAVPIRQRVPAMPVRLAAVIDQALVDKPEIGFKTARELKSALENALA
jgi:pSer/pThr/pTyr-binding forkhead associated (FHA) protein